MRFQCAQHLELLVRARIRVRIARRLHGDKGTRAAGMMVLQHVAQDSSS